MRSCKLRHILMPNLSSRN